MNDITENEIVQILLSIKNGVGNSSSKKKQKQWKERDFLIFLLLLNTGINIPTLIKLNVDDIDCNNNQLKLCDNTIIDMPKQIMDYVNFWLDKRTISLDGATTNALFISSNKKRISATAIYSIVNKYSSTIKDKHITPYKLRTTFTKEV